MAEQASSAEVRQALYDLHRYLSDQLAPMMVAEAVEQLLDYPPELVAREINGWVAAQFRGSSNGLTVSDCIYHAMKKLHMVMEFELLEKAQLEGYLDKLGGVVLELCPSEERELLKENLGRLGQSEDPTATPAAMLHRQERPRGPAESKTTGAGDDVARGVRRLSLLIERLAGSAPPGPGGTPAPARAELETQLLTTAAVSARNRGEFEQHVHRLEELGIDARLDRVFRSLGRSLPGWALPAPPGEDPAAVTLPPSRPAEAMRRIASMAADTEEGARRFNDLVQAAIEQFNEGRLVQAMTMLQLAQRVAAERKLNVEVVKTIRERARDALSQERLRGFAERSDKHETLRQVLAFFAGLTPEGLLASLYGEARRDRRKLLLALLEVHGAPARAAALERLEACAANGAADAEGYFRRNLVFLLRRIPRPPDSPIEHETELLVRLSGLENPNLLIKESLAALGHLPGERAERALMDRLHQLEQLLIDGGKAAHDADERRALIDRAVAALAHLGTTNAFRTIVAHALRREPKLGDTMARLDELADHDLSRDPELIDRLVAILQQELPSKVLGLVMGKSNPAPLHLVRALSGTPLPAVMQALEGVRQRFPERDLGEEAAKALARLGAASKSEAPSRTLTGDVELFGLPNLFQTLADSQVTGVLHLADGESETTATLTFEAGKVRGCEVGVLRGEIAFYQLFEKPVPGTFTFKSQAEGTAPVEGVVIEVMPAMLEAIRRHDEFREACALVPDGALLRRGAKKPTGVEDETERAFLQQVWERASAGTAPEAIETALAVDSYRVRRCLAHWVEEGSLQPA